MPSLRGAYVYGDYGSGTRLGAGDAAGRRAPSNEEISRVDQVASFGEDGRGEVYAVSLGGSIWRFRERGGGTPPPSPRRCRPPGCSGTRRRSRRTRALIPYDVNAPLWSDGADKRRWLALPNVARIGFDAADAWSFPRGTVLVKHFEIDCAWATASGGGSRRAC